MNITQLMFLIDTDVSIAWQFTISSNSDKISNLPKGFNQNHSFLSAILTVCLQLCRHEIVASSHFKISQKILKYLAVKNEPFIFLSLLTSTLSRFLSFHLCFSLSLSPHFCYYLSLSLSISSLLLLSLSISPLLLLSLSLSKTKTNKKKMSGIIIF